MSYDIFYRKQFIKVSDTEVIPFFEAGSNNCYEACSRKRVGRRSRSWDNQRINGKTIVTNKELIQFVEDYQESLIKRGIEWNKDSNDDSYTYNPDRFGYHAGLSIKGYTTAKTTYKHFFNFYKNGIKTAKTIEELRANNILIELVVSQYSEKKITELGLERKPSVTLSSTEQLVKLIKEYEEYYKDVPGCFYLTTFSEWSLTKYFSNNKQRRMKKEKELITLKEYYVIKCPNGGILARLTHGGYKYVDTLAYYNSVKIFKTEKQANTFLTTANRSGFSVLKCSNEIQVRM